MEFRIADTFTDSLSRLTKEEQKAAKTTAFDLQMNPSHPGMSFHKLDRAKDKNFWSVRVNSDIRLIVHKTQSSLLLCYVDHHDDAYSWAERRKLEVHPATGAAQLVEIREMIKEVIIPVYTQQAGLAPDEIGLFVRSVSQIPRAVHSVELAKATYTVLDETMEAPSNAVAISTMHLAKGLEFKSVVIMACDDEVIPSQERIASVTEVSDLEEVYNTERQLLYVASTRARDSLLITGVEPVSEFLDDLGAN